MSWQKFSDRARESRKVRRASPDAITLWWAIGNWCCEHKTDGFVARDEIADCWRPIGRRFNHSAAAKELVELGLLEDHGDKLEVHDFLEFNPSREDDEERKGRDARRAKAYRARQAALKSPQNPSSVTLDVTQRDERERHAADVTGDPSTPRHAPLVPSRPVPLRSEKRSSAAVPRVDFSAEVRALEERYPAEVVAQARQGCALSRRSGQMSDSRWLTTLKALAAHPQPAVVDAMQAFVERYADGQKDERYLIAMARNGAKPKQASLGSRPAEALTEEQVLERARARRLEANRRANGC